MFMTMFRINKQIFHCDYRGVILMTVIKKSNLRLEEVRRKDFS